MTVFVEKDVLHARVSAACEAMVVSFARRLSSVSNYTAELGSHIVGNALAPAILELEPDNVPTTEEIRTALLDGLKRAKATPPVGRYSGMYDGILESFDDDGLDLIAERLSEIWARNISGLASPTELTWLLESAKRYNDRKGDARDDVKLERAGGFWRVAYRTDGAVLCSATHPMLEVAAYLCGIQLGDDWRGASTPPGE